MTGLQKILKNRNSLFISIVLKKLSTLKKNDSIIFLTHLREHYTISEATATQPHL
ncbi:glycosyl transferase family 1 [Acetobacter orientalis]|uniref:Glycosyl transferase family 1 n=1 Tax=Acetobacter orientalis TaxID=146474 RepID=A0A2Z5ZD53_9PROT|nr:glycosyl transferase family 1 [Acetobacter orientalis]